MATIADLLPKGVLGNNNIKTMVATPGSREMPVGAINLLEQIHCLQDLIRSFGRNGKKRRQLA